LNFVAYCRVNSRKFAFVLDKRANAMSDAGVTLWKRFCALA